MEVNSCRERLAPFCVGNGLDIGFGGEPIVPSAICLDREPGHPHRAIHPNPTPTQLVGEASNLHWFKDGVLDYVFSSHCLEDFEDTVGVLREWLRVLKSGGYLILFLPDEQAYRAYVGGIGNAAHKHENFSLHYVMECLRELKIYDWNIVHWNWPVHNNDYSFDLVVRKP